MVAVLKETGRTHWALERDFTGGVLSGARPGRSPGLSAGAAYALVAVGVVLIFKGTKALSIAQGEIGAFGFFLGLRWADRGYPRPRLAPAAVRRRS